MKKNLPPNFRRICRAAKNHYWKERYRAAELPGWVPFPALCEIDARERRRCNIHPRTYGRSFRHALWLKNVKKKKNKGVTVYNVESYFDIFLASYTERDARCSRQTLESYHRSHLHATPEILNNRDYMTRADLKKHGIGVGRLMNWLRAWQLVAYLRGDGKKLLYSLTEVRELAAWRHASWLRRRFGEKKYLKIAATHPKLEIKQMGKCSYFYHCPEYIHL